MRHIYESSNTTSIMYAITRILFFLLLGVACINAQCSQSPSQKHQYGHCQEYDVKVEFGKAYYVCKNYGERIGRCPAISDANEDSFVNTESIQCSGDWFCPPGFKCCKYNNEQPTYVCKKADYSVDVKGKPKDDKKHNNKNGDGKTAGKNNNAVTATNPDSSR